MILTTENYHTTEANEQYLSCSQVKRWLECPARAIAEFRGEWKRPVSDALTFGSYVDNALTQPDKLDVFKREHPDMFKKDGEIKAVFALADDCIAKVRNCKHAYNMLTGGSMQEIYTGLIYGVPFRGMMDSVHHDKKVIVDLKTTRGFGDFWCDRQRKKLPWYDGYWLQAAIYRELLRQNTGEVYEFTLLAVSKQTPPAGRCIAFPSEDPAVSFRLDSELERVKTILPDLMSQREGEPAPGCEDFENCEYCRSQSDFDFVLAKV